MSAVDEHKEGHDDGHGAVHGGGAGGAHGDAHGEAHGGGGHGHKHHGGGGGGGPGAPLWMLSFADMMTNLLCFFILMSAFASVQQGIQFEDWLGSIKSDLIGSHRPSLASGHNVAFQFGAGRVIYRAASPINTKTLVEADGKITDTNRDALRDVIVEGLKQPGKSTLPTPILFEPGSAALSAGHRAFLKTTAETLTTGKFPLRIEGYAFDEGIDVDLGWELSEARARAVADELIADGIAAARVTCIAHGMMRAGAETRVASLPLPQNVYGRRAVLITFLN